MAQARMEAGTNASRKRRRDEEKERRQSFLQNLSRFVANTLPDETLQRGATGEPVRRLQQVLAQLGYDVGPSDGIFGPRTESALRAYQRGAGLPETGVYTARERETLARVSQVPERTRSVAGGRGLLRQGSRGPAVRDLQVRLRSLGFDPGPTDAIFGPRTAAAVRAFQQAAGIKPDAIVGPVTRSALATAAEQAIAPTRAEQRRRALSRRVEDWEGAPSAVTRSPQRPQRSTGGRQDAGPRTSSAETSPVYREIARQLAGRPPQAGSGAQALRRLAQGVAGAFREQAEGIRRGESQQMVDLERHIPPAVLDPLRQGAYGFLEALMIPELASVVSRRLSASGAAANPLLNAPKSPEEWEALFGGAPDTTSERVGRFVGNVVGNIAALIPAGGVATRAVLGLGRAGAAAATRLGAEQALANLARTRAGQALARVAGPTATGAIAGGLYGAYQEAARELESPEEADFAQRLRNALSQAGLYGAYGAAYPVAGQARAALGERIAQASPRLAALGRAIGERSPLAAELGRGTVEGAIAGGLVGAGRAAGQVVAGQPVQAAAAQVPQEAGEEVAENIVEAVALRLAQILAGGRGLPIPPVTDREGEPQAAQPEARPEQAPQVPQPQAAQPAQRPAPQAEGQAPAQAPPQAPQRPAAPQQAQPAQRATQPPAAPAPAQPQPQAPRVAPATPAEAPAERSQRTPQEGRPAHPQQPVTVPDAGERSFVPLRPGDLLQGKVPVTTFGDLTPNVEYVPVEWVKQFGQPRSYSRQYVRRAAQQLEKQGFREPITVLVGRDGTVGLSDDSRTAIGLAAAEHLGLDQVPVVVRVQDTVPHGARANIGSPGEATVLRPSQVFTDIPSARPVEAGEAEQAVARPQPTVEATPAAPQPEQAPAEPAPGRDQEPEATPEPAAQQEIQPQAEAQPPQAPATEQTQATAPVAETAQAQELARTEATPQQEATLGIPEPRDFGAVTPYVEFVPTEWVRQFREYDREAEPKEEGALERLVEDIRQNGIREPLVIYVGQQDRRALLAEGNTRLAAAIRLGIREVPVRVVRRTRVRRGVRANLRIPAKQYVPEDLRPSQAFADLPSARPAQAAAAEAQPPAAPQAESQPPAAPRPQAEAAPQAPPAQTAPMPPQPAQPAQPEPQEPPTRPERSTQWTPEALERLPKSRGHLAWVVFRDMPNIPYEYFVRGGDILRAEHDVVIELGTGYRFGRFVTVDRPDERQRLQQLLEQDALLMVGRIAEAPAEEAAPPAPAQPPAPSATTEAAPSGTAATPPRQEAPTPPSEQAAPAGVPAAEQAPEALPPVEFAQRGKTARVRTPDGTRVEVQYALAEADDLITSHTVTLAQDPRYPQELQPRDRSRMASELQVERIARELDPELLGQSPTAVDGAPIVGPDGVVESGNGRTIALKRVYTRPELEAQRQAYRAWLEENAEEFGLDPEQVRKMNRPVLVRLRLSDVDRQAFTREANVASTARMAAAEQAAVDAERLTLEDLATLDPESEGNLLAEGNREFVRRFLAKVPQNELGNLITDDGKLSQEGVVRLRNAIMAKAYPNPALLERLFEDTDTNIRNVANALMVSAGRVARFHAAAERGERWPQLDIANDLAQAAYRLAVLRDQRVPVETYLAQTSLMGDELSPAGKALLRLFDQVKRSQKTLAALLERYYHAADAADAPDQVSLFGGPEPPDPVVLLEAAAQKVMREVQADGGQQSLLAQGAEAGPGEGAPRAGVADRGGAQGAQVASEAGAAAEAEGRADRAPAAEPQREEGSVEAPATKKPKKKGSTKQAKRNQVAAPDPRLVEQVRDENLFLVTPDDLAQFDQLLPVLHHAQTVTVSGSLQVTRQQAVALREALRGWEVFDNGDGTFTFVRPEQAGPANEVKEFYARYGVRRESDPAEARERAQDALQDLLGAAVAATRITPPSARGRRGRLLALGIRSDLVRTGWVDFRGQEVRSPADLAALAQVVRDPRFETFRVFYVRGNTIVGQEAFTSRMPDSVLLWPTERAARHLTTMRRRMERLKADGFYVLHNHPSGFPHPSGADIQMTTEVWAKRLPGFRGHVVIDSGRYAVIEADGRWSIHDIDLGGEDELLSPALPHPLLGAQVLEPGDAMRLGRAFYTEGGQTMPVLLYADAKLRVRAVQQVPRGLFRSHKAAGDYIRGRAREFGAGRVFFYDGARGGEVDPFVLYSLIADGVLTDAIFHDGRRLVSMAAQYRVSPEPHMALGRRLDTLYAVREDPDDRVSLGDFLRTFAAKADAPRRPRAGVRARQIRLSIDEQPAVRADGTPTDEARLSEERERELEALSAGLAESRPEIVPPSVPDVVGKHPDVAAALAPHQRDGVNLAIAALDEPPHGFYLMDGTGAGKTMQGLGIAFVARARGAKKVLILTEREKIVDDAWLRDAQRFGPDLAGQVRKWRPGEDQSPGIYVSWYHQLDVKRPIPTKGWDLVIFDEAQNMKNVLRGTKRAELAKELEASTPRVVYMSATPVDRPTDFRYFGHRLGLFEDDPYEFDVWVANLGLQPRTRTIVRRKQEITIKEYVRLPGVTWNEVANRVDAQMAELKRKGRLIKREVPMKGLEVIIDYQPLSKEARETQRKIIAALALPDGTSRNRGLELTYLRRHLENYKIDRAVEIAKRELAEGRQVVIFAGYKEKSVAEKIERYGWETIRVPIHESESVIKELRSRLEEIVGEGNVAELHGGIQGEAKPNVQEEIRAYQSGQKRVAIATLSMASTGVSLHDEHGLAPRTQIMLTLPWSAMEHVQAAGRSHRLTSKSNTRLYVLLTDSEIDRVLGSVLGAKMKLLKAVVKGDLDKIDIHEGVKRLEYGAGMVMDEVADRALGPGVNPSTEDAVMAGEYDDLEAMMPGESAPQEEAGDDDGGGEDEGGPGDGAGSMRVAPSSRQEIIRFIEKAFGTYVGTGRLRVPKALGQYDARQDVIRTKFAEDLPTIAHELGHKLDRELGLRTKAGRYAAELIALGRATSPEGATAPYLYKEGIAQFIRYWLTGEQDTILLAPGFQKNVWEPVLRDNPEVREKLEQVRDMTRAWLKLPPYEAVRGVISFEPVKEKVPMSRALRRVWERFYTRVVDRLAPLERTVFTLTQGRPVPILKDPARRAALLRGIAGRAEAWLYGGQYVYDDKSDRFMKIGRPLAEILAPVSKTRKDLDDFVVYAVAKTHLEHRRHEAERNQRREEQGLPPLPPRQSPIPDEYAEQLVSELETPERKRALRELTQYRRNLYRVMEDAGLLEPGTVDRFEEVYEFNVPFYREFMEGHEDATAQLRRGTGRTFADLPAPLARLKGSTRTIINPIESLIRDTYMALTLAERNKVMGALVALRRKHRDLGELIEIDIPPNKIPHVRRAEEILSDLRRLLQESNIDTSPLDWEGLQEAFRGKAIVDWEASTRKRGKEAREYIVVFWEGGEPKFARLDPELYEAVLALDTMMSSWLVRILSWPAKLYRKGVTMTPEFIARNMFRDIFSSVIFSEAGITPVDWVRGLFHALKRDQLYWEWKAAGGGYSDFTSLDRDSLHKAVEDIAQLRHPSMPRRALEATVEWVRRMLETTESAARIAEFEKTLKQAGESASAYALAAERSRSGVNVDFARMGSATREINAVVPFYNAGVQELDKIVTAFAKHPWRTIMRGTMWVTLPTLLLYLANRDDENYWELPQWRRDAFWNIPIGNGHFVSLPIPFMMGVIFKTIPERIFQFIDQQDPEAFDELGKAIVQSGLPGTVLSERVPVPLPIPQALVGMLELYANRRTFSGTPIVPRREMDAFPDLPELWYGPQTTETAKLLGKALGLAPRKIDHFARAYGGALGEGAMKGADFLLEKVGLVKPVPRPKEYKGMWFVGDFVTDELATTIDRFYTDLARTKSLYNKYRQQLEMGQRVDITRREYDALRARYRAMDKVSRQLAELRKLQRQVLESDRMTGEEKREALRQIELQMTNLVRYAYGKPPLTK